MTEIHIITSDTELDSNFLANLYHTRSEQKFLYRSPQQAAAYYKIPFESSPDRGVLKNPKSIFKFLSPIFNENKKIAFISLGCGNAFIEKDELEQLYKSGINFTYFGVDSSAAMLELARETLRDVSFPVHFVCADISSPSFVPEFRHLISGYDSRIFAFIGNTFGNVSANYIGNSLSNLLEKDDFLFADLYIRKEISEYEKSITFDHYKKVLSRDQESYFWFTNIPESLNVPKESLKKKVEMTEDELVGAIKIQSSVKFITDLKVSFKNRQIFFQKNSVIDIVNFYIYDPEKLKDFMELRKFKSINKKTFLGEVESEGLFLFQKV